AFNDTALSAANASGQNFFSNSLSWASSLDASAGIVLNHDQTDSSGLPAQYIPFAAPENTFDTEHAGNKCAVKPCNESLAIWPGPMVPMPNGTILIPFGLIARGGPISGFVGEGAAIAVATVNKNGTLTVRRPIEGTGRDPFLLWPAGVQGFTDEAFVYNNYYYAYGGHNVFVTTEDILARVPVAKVLDLSAWTYYAGKGVWSANEADAVTVFDGSASGSSVFYDAYLKDWVAIFSGNFSNNLYYAVAHAPEGPWSKPVQFATGLAGYDNNADYAGRAHPEFSPDGGKTEYVTYVQSTGAFGQDLPTLQIVFGKN
ncbi:MAG: DUF4185 domain-containing protein, partial [Acidocella sp.]|nr:DUF4185 domain-containing protein [Acidocella sp.]